MFKKAIEIDPADVAGYEHLARLFARTGRLPEAVQPMRAGMRNYVSQEQWEFAARVAGNLSELTLTLGDLTQAVASAEESVELADRSGDAFRRMADRTSLADALHQAGRWEESAASFREAEAMQAERQPEYPRLYSLRGYRYCDLLLSRAASAGSAGGPPARGDEVTTFVLSGR